MIVGNGEINASAAAQIDAADLIVRFNDCRTYGIGGSRTDIVAVCNTGDPAKTMLSSNVWKNHPCVSQATELWGVRSPQLFARMRKPLLDSHPELYDFCDDYTMDFEAFCAESGKSFRIIDETVHRDTDRDFAKSAINSYIVPSSGIIVIRFLLNTAVDAEIYIAGFSHSGWDGHPFAAEKLVVDSYVSAGLLKRIGTPAQRKFA